MFTVLSSWQSHCESSPGSFDECRMAPSGRRPKTKPDDLGCESACAGCQSLHPPSPIIIITQPESWYSFYRPTEGRRLSPPSWVLTYRDGLPVQRRSPILALTGSDVAPVAVLEFSFWGATGVATLSSGVRHTTNTFVLNCRVCNHSCQIINT